MSTILIIERYQSLGELYRLVLGQFGHDALMASSGEAGIQAFLEQKPDLIVLDLFLNELTGGELLRQLQESGILNDTPPIVTTAPDEMASQSITRSVGASAVLVKPFNMNPLITAVQLALAGAGKQHPPGPDTVFHNRIVNNPVTAQGTPASESPVFVADWEGWDGTIMVLFG